MNVYKFLNHTNIDMEFTAVWAPCELAYMYQMHYWLVCAPRCASPHSIVVIATHIYTHVVERSHGTIEAKRDQRNAKFGLACHIDYELMAPLGLPRALDPAQCAISQDFIVKTTYIPTVA